MNNNYIRLPFVFLVIALSGCATVGPELTQISINDIKPITFDYSIPNASKEILFKRARNHFATVYGDSRSVIRVEDANEGVILGKGAVEWKLATGSFVIPYHSCPVKTRTDSIGC